MRLNLFFRSLLVVIFFCLGMPEVLQAVETPASLCTTCGFESEAKALETLQKHYQELSENGGWPEWPQGKKVKPHQSDPRISLLHELLTITGDYQGSGKATATRYDEALVLAVEQFQMRHGLNPDGTLGKATQAALAVPVEVRLSQIAATIARIRTRPQAPESRFILVNLPAFMLYAVDQGHTRLGMRVIIGSRKNPTPLFDNIVTDVIFNPQWHVPPKIARNELIPKLRENPDYFLHAGFVVTEDGQPVDPKHINSADTGDFSFRQLAGSDNALGKVKFNIPDKDNIYLHSTASPKLFEKDERALSHGCVRVEEPRKLVHFMLESEKGWNEERIDAAYDASREHWAHAQVTPVHFVYWTAFVDASGTAYFFDDVYGKDAAVMAYLNEKPVALAAK